MIAITLQYITLMCVFQFISLLGSMGVGFFLLTITMIADVKRTVRTLKKCKKNESQFTEQLCEFIRFHSIAQQLSSFLFLLNMNPNKNYFSPNFNFRLVHDVSKIAQPIFMIVFSWSCAALCLVMLTIKLELVE